MLEKDDTGGVGRGRRQDGSTCHAVTEPGDERLSRIVLVIIDTPQRRKDDGMPDIEIESKDGTRAEIVGDKHIIPATIGALAELAKSLFPFGRNKPSALVGGSPNDNDDRNERSSRCEGEGSDP